jgi:glycine cleavage system H protein
MNARAKKLIRDLAAAAAVVLLMAALPLALAALLVMRAVLLAGVLLMLVAGMLLASTSRTFRRWVGIADERGLTVAGLFLPDDVKLHPAHAWARLGWRHAVIGADDIMQATLGPVERVIVPPPGTEVRRGDPLFELRRNGRVILARAPLHGTVVRTNDALIASPQLVNEAPYHSGWIVRLRPDRQGHDEGCLVDGGAAQEWFRRQVEEVIGVLVPGQPALADGGIVVRDLHDRIDEPAWREITRRFFDAAS